jgi:Fic family protein/DNA-binding XRE family transcriptional regulator
MNKESSQKLNEILTNACWTQEQLARYLDVPQKTINLWLNNKSRPRVANEEKINEAYLDIVGRTDVDAAVLDNINNQARSKKITAAKILRDEDLLDKLTLHLTYHTNTIEGSTMTLADVREVLEDDTKVLSNKTAREQIEARNHKAALYFLLGKLQGKGVEFRWSEQLILETHLRLLNSLASDAGTYRNHSVRIMGTTVVLANHIKVPELMDGLIKNLNTPTKDVIGHIAHTHAVFEKIHPFSDGNGRTGRLIAFIQALQAGLVPPLVTKERKRAYYKYLEVAQTKEAYDLLTLFIAESILFTDSLIEDKH